MELPELTTFTHKATFDNRFGLKMPIVGAQASFFEKELDGKTISAGLYKLDGKDIYIAWGDKNIEHCEAHALLFTDSPVISPGCVDFIVKDSSIIFKEGDKEYIYLMNETPSA